MEPIQPVGINRPDLSARLGAIRDLFQGGGTSPIALMPQNRPTQPVSGLEISTSVNQLLQSIGNGVQSNKMLELMVTLLILLTMLEQQQSSKASESALGSLGGLSSGRTSSSASLSITTMSFQSSSVSITQFNAVQGCTPDSGPTATPRLDVTG